MTRDETWAAILDLCNHLVVWITVESSTLCGWFFEILTVLSNWEQVLCFDCFSQDSHTSSAFFLQWPDFAYHFLEANVWSTLHDEMLCREILVVDPFTGTRRSTVARARGAKWEQVTKNLNKIQHICTSKLTRGQCEAVTITFQGSWETNWKKKKRETKASGNQTDDRRRSSTRGIN